MSLADRITDERTKAQGGRCRFGRLQAAVSEDDWRVLTSAIEEIRANRLAATERGRATVNQMTGLSGAALSRALRAEGHDISKDVVQAHAYWHCRCGF